MIKTKQDKEVMDHNIPKDCLKTLQESVQTHSDQDEKETSKKYGNLMLNEVLLLREENLKVEMDIETNADDPLNIHKKMEIKVEPTEIPQDFNGENECDEFANDHAAAQMTPGTRPNRKRKSKLEKHETKLMYESSTDYDNATETFNETFSSSKKEDSVRSDGNELNAWTLLFTETMLASILKHTNNEMRTRKIKACEEKNYQRPLDQPELCAWIGLNYLCGIFCKNGATLEELWTVELGNGIFRASMTRQRFEQIRDCLSLGERVKMKRKKDFHEKLQIVTEIWKEFIENCRKNFEPGDRCTLHKFSLDQSAVMYHQNFDSGIHILGLHDSQTNYLCDALLGKCENSNDADVLSLVDSIKNSKRQIITPQHLTSLQLAQDLLKHQLYLVGSLDLKSRDFPKEFSSAKKRQTLKRTKAKSDFSFIPINNSSKVLLTSSISDESDVIDLFVTSSPAGQMFHQKTEYFSTRKMIPNTDPLNSTFSWSLNFFYILLDFACLNACLLFRGPLHNDPAAVKQRDFQRKLALHLTRHHLKRLLHKNSKTPLERKLLISDILGKSSENLLCDAASTRAQATVQFGKQVHHAPDYIQLLPKKTEKRGRCRICTWRNNNLTSWKCQQCARALCPDHLINRCTECLGMKRKGTREEVQEQDEYFK